MKQTKPQRGTVEPSVALIVLTWNNYNDTVECVDSLLRLEYSNCRIIVVDNHSTDGSVRRLRRKYPQALFIENEENLGFAIAMNRGLKYAFDNGFDYGLLLNNDLKVKPDCVGKLVAVAERRSDLGVLSPAILDYDTGVVDNTGWNFHPRNGYATKIRPDATGAALPVVECDFVSGCVMLMKRDVVRKAGFLNENLFLLTEDLDYGLRCRNAGLSAAAVTGAHVFHKNALTMSKDSLPRFYYGARNHIRLLFRHRRHFRLWRSLGTFLLFDMRLQLLKVLGDRDLSVGLKRARACAILRGLWHGFTGRRGRCGVVHYVPKGRRPLPRVLFVESGGGLGGSMRDLAAMLHSGEWKRWRLEVALTNPRAETRLLDEIGVPYFSLDVPHFKEGGSRVAKYLRMLTHLFRCFRFGRRLAAGIRKRRIDLVHLNNELFAGLPALFGALLAGVPATCHLRSQRPPALVERLASLFCRRLASISDTGARFFRRRLPAAGKRIFVIKNSHEEVKVSRGDDRPDKAVGMLSNFLPGKGHEFFIDAVPEIARRHPEARFLLAGAELPGVEGCLRRLRSRAMENGAASRINFLPWQDDVSAFLSRVDILVDCSYLAEGYRRTIVEGMLSGAAVVATDVGPAREIIRDRVTGMLAKPRSAGSIVDAVCALLDDERLRRKIALNGRAVARKAFSVERSVGVMQELFLASARGGGV